MIDTISVMNSIKTIFLVNLIAMAGRYGLLLMLNAHRPALMGRAFDYVAAISAGFSHSAALTAASHVREGASVSG